MLAQHIKLNYFKLVRFIMPFVFQAQSEGTPLFFESFQEASAALTSSGPSTPLLLLPSPPAVSARRAVASRRATMATSHQLPAAPSNGCGNDCGSDSDFSCGSDCGSDFDVVIPQALLALRDSYLCCH